MLIIRSRGYYTISESMELKAPKLTHGYLIRPSKRLLTRPEIEFGQLKACLRLPTPK